MSLALYYHPLASYCHKVLIALYAGDIACEKRLIDLGDPGHRAELGAIWPLVKFPVLRDAALGRDVPESSAIIEYLDHHYSARMLPRDWEGAFEARLWDRFFDNHVQTPMQAIVLDRIMGQNTAMERERAALTTAYGILEQQLAKYEWAASDEFSMADCAAAPALFYAMTLVPFPAGAVQLPGYFDRLMAYPPVQRTMDEARPYFSMYPFEEAIPARFR
ncbi:MAG TPA: glutathione S-transferase family protein [Burkholderiaceae bacterium]